MSSDGFRAAANSPHRPDQIGETFERKVLTVERNQHSVCGDERVEREQSERRRAIDEDVIEARAQRIEDPLQAMLALGQRHHLDFCAGQIAVRGHERQSSPRVSI